MALLEDLLTEYAQVKVILKKWDDKAKGLNAKIKTAMKAVNMTVANGDGFKFEFITQRRRTVNEFKAIQFLKDNGFGECVIMKESVDESAVAQAIESGALDVTSFDNACVDVKLVEQLRMTEGTAEVASAEVKV